MVNGITTEDSQHFSQAFTQYGALLQGSAKRVQKVEYYINPILQANFDKKMAEFKAAGKSDQPIWIFHGSDSGNIPLIMEGGFKVGGKTYGGKKFPVANGAVHGQGVYSATGPNTPMAYSARAGTSSQIILVRIDPSSHRPHRSICRMLFSCFQSADAGPLKT